MISAVRRVVKLAQDLWILWHRHSCQALLPVLSGKNKYYCARLSARPARCPLTPTIIFERARGSRGSPDRAVFARAGVGEPGSPERAVFCAGWGGIEMPSPANEPLRSLDFVAQHLLPVLSGHDKHHAHAFQLCSRCPLIPLSSLSEPAGAGAELARVGEPRASRKDDSPPIQCVHT